MTIAREVTIGNIRLLQGDMRAVLPQLDLQAKLVLSDPPYRLVTGGGSTSKMGGALGPDQYDNTGQLFPMVEWAEMAPLIRDALAEDADAVIMTSDREEGEARVAFLQSGLAFHRLLIWHKITATPNRWYMPNCEFALYMYKGRARTITDCGSKALVRCPQTDVSHLYIPKHHFTDGRRPAPHPTEKPVALMQHWLVNSTEPGDLVLDPFMGAGATMVAAARAGRAAVGIELNPMWFDVTVARVREAVGVAESCPSKNAPLRAVQGDLWA